VLIDEQTGRGRFAARHAGQAPEVDSVTYVQGQELPVGRFIRVRCVGAKGYDLIARPSSAILPSRS
jgi:hypothetical protein